MELKLSPSAVALIEEELHSAAFETPEQVVEAALELWSGTRSTPIEVVDPNTGRVRSDDEVRAMIQAGLDDIAAGRVEDVDLDDLHRQALERLRQRAGT